MKPTPRPGDKDKPAKRYCRPTQMWRRSRRIWKLKKWMGRSRILTRLIWDAFAFPRRRSLMSSLPGRHCGSHSRARVDDDERLQQRPRGTCARHLAADRPAWFPSSFGRADIEKGSPAPRVVSSSSFRPLQCARAAFAVLAPLLTASPDCCRTVTDQPGGR